MIALAPLQDRDPPATISATAGRRWDGPRANRLQTDGSDQRIFDSLHDQRFHLLGRQTWRLGLNRYLRWCELGKHSQTRMLSRVQAEEDNEACYRDYDSTETEREFNDRVEHR